MKDREVEIRLSHREVDLIITALKSLVVFGIVHEVKKQLMLKLNSLPNF